jgi:hypothetical protein
MNQLMYSQGLSACYKLTVDKNHFLSLEPATPEECKEVKEYKPIGDFLDAVLAADVSPEFKDRDFLDEYEAVMGDYRSAEPKEGWVDMGSAHYSPDFCAAAEKFLTDNLVSFDAYLPVRPAIGHRLDIMIDTLGKHVPGACRYYVTFGGKWLYKLNYGQTKEGKSDEHFNLDELYDLGWVPELVDDKNHKTNALGVQCARLNLEAVQAYSKYREDIKTGNLYQPTGSVTNFIG